MSYHAIKIKLCRIKGITVSKEQAQLKKEMRLLVLNGKNMIEGLNKFNGMWTNVGLFDA